MDDPVKRKTITASKLIQPVCSSYDANFKLMAIKNAGKKQQLHCRTEITHCGRECTIVIYYCLWLQIILWFQLMPNFSFPH
jgi:hypothetical protein